MQIQYLILNALKIWDFGAKLEVSENTNAKASDNDFKANSFNIYNILLGIQTHHNMLNMMLDLKFKGLKLVIQYVQKDITHLIASDYDKYVLFPLLVHVCRKIWTSLLWMIFVVFTLRS
jgi:hypothetical protein